MDDLIKRRNEYIDALRAKKKMGEKIAEVGIGIMVLSAVVFIILYLAFRLDVLIFTGIGIIICGLVTMWIGQAFHLKTLNVYYAFLDTNKLKRTLATPEPTRNYNVW